MRLETYTSADQRAETFLESILEREHAEGEVAKAVRAGNVWRALSSGVGWNPNVENGLAIDGRFPERCEDCWREAGRRMEAEGRPRSEIYGEVLLEAEKGPSSWCQRAFPGRAMSWNDSITVELSYYGAVMWQEHSGKTPEGNRVTLSLWEAALVFGKELYLGNDSRYPFATSDFTVTPAVAS